MSLYDGLEIDAKEGGGRDKRPDVSGWGSSLKMLQVQKQLQAKNKASLMQPKRRGGPTIAPVIDLKKTGGESLHFNQLTGKLERAMAAASPAPPVQPVVQPQPPSMFIAQDPPSLGILTNLTGVNDEYNPFQPNDYDEYIKKRKESRKRERDDRRSRNDRVDRERDDDSRHGSPYAGPWPQHKDRNNTPRPGGDYDRERRRPDRRRNYDDQDNDRENESEFEKRRRRRAEEEEEEEERERDRSRKPGAGAAIAPPQALLEDTGSPPRDDDDSPPDMDERGLSPPRAGLGAGFTAAGSVASKIMAKYGYREGQGLGKKEQGMSTALFVEKTSKRGGKIIHEKDIPKEMDMFGDNIDMEAVDSMNFPAPPAPGAEGIPRVPGQTNAELLKNPTKVILLRNMVGPGEVDDDLEGETSEECSKYGKVVKCIIFEIANGDEDEAVRIFLEFERMESAIKAVVDLNGRYFGGRMVKATFYNLDKMRRLALADPV